MEEKQYLEIAIQLNEKDLLKSFWEKVARTQTWYSLNNNTQTKFVDLDDDHLKNIIKMLARFNSDTSRPALCALIGEASNRHIL